MLDFVFSFAMVEDYLKLLLPDQAAPETITTLLAPVRFADRPAALACLQRIGRDPDVRGLLAQVLPTLLIALSEVAQPDRVLVSLERFARNRDDQAPFFQFLADQPRAVELMVTLLAGSRFLTEILLRHPDYFERLTDRRQLADRKPDNRFLAEARAAIAPYRPEGQAENAPLDTPTAARMLDALRRWQRWHLLRLGACDLLGLMDIPTVTRQLSNLADSLIQTCLSICAQQTKIDPTGFVVLGMGKLGGQELNYSSDIDLLFISDRHHPPFLRLGQYLIEALSKVTAEGFLYRVDMRLRPWGRMGSLVISVQGYLDYLTNSAHLWEKQALIKARALAGDKEIGRQFLQGIEPLLYEASAEAVRTSLRTNKERIEENLRKNGRNWGEVKLGEGSIRDVEFVTQYLQLVHGRAIAQLRPANTLEALAQLARYKILSPGAYQTLAAGYTFLRPVEHYLQMMNYQQTHTLPTDEEALDHLARRLGFRGGEAGADFIEHYRQHTEAIREVYRHYLGDDETSAPAVDHPRRPLSHTPATYAASFSPAEIDRHHDLLVRLSDDHQIEVEAIPTEDGTWRITIAGYDYLGALSLICGLMFIYRLNILDGYVHTFEVADGQIKDAALGSQRLKLVDVFTVRPETAVPANGDQTSLADPEFWQGYARDLERLLQKLAVGDIQAVQAELVKRFADVMGHHQDAGETAPILYPIDIEIDIESDDQYTILRIDTPDTLGFLYEFANALTLNGIYIGRVVIDTSGNRIQDTLYVTDAQGRKITAGRKLFEMRAATVLVKHFTHLLPLAPNPALALTHFHEFLGQLFTRPDWPTEVASLIRPEVLDALARLLGVSDFLWDDFLRMQHTNLFPVIQDVANLAMVKTQKTMQTELDAALQFASDQATRRQLLNNFKDREMFRIDMRHILGHITEYGQFSGELSDLAEVVMETAFRICFRELRAQHGEPRQRDGQPGQVSVCALGKFGGRELGYASDIELMIIFDASGETTGPEVIASNAFYEKLVQSLISTIKAKHEGIFEIDLRLRPYGRAGRMAVPLASFRRYFDPEGPAWDYERQALVKLRPVSGDPNFGQQIIALRDRQLYDGQPFDVATMRGMRERQVRHLITPGTINAKYSPGGLVDIEYLVQGLQISYGHRSPELRVANTREAMTALHRASVLTDEDYQSLVDSYNFLRRVINALRMVRGNAKDLTIPPTDSEEFAFLARRLDYGDDFYKLHEELTHYTAAVQTLNEKLFQKLVET